MNRRGTIRHGPRTEGDRFGGDGGVATLWVAGAIAVVFLVVLAGVWLAAATVARHRANSAADLAALAAASRARDGSGEACARAGWVAERMRAELARCTLEGWDSLIEVTVRPQGALGGFGAASAHARAGPVSP